MKKLLLIALLLVGCNKTVTVHVGSLNTFDSVTADTLTGVKAAIDQTRPKLQNGTLPAKLQPMFTALVNAYNSANTAYGTWRNLVKANADSSTALTTLNAALVAVTQALTAYTAAGGK